MKALLQGVVERLVDPALTLLWAHVTPVDVWRSLLGRLPGPLVVDAVHMSRMLRELGHVSVSVTAAEQAP